MRKYKDKRPRQTTRSTLGIVINEKSGNFSQKKIDTLIGEIARSRHNWHIIKAEQEKEVVFQLKKLISRRPVGIIACGGDSTVNLVARYLIRRTCALGIYPSGKFNNIYRSLYGEPDTKKAIKHILSKETRKIDYGLAGGNFFLGSIGLGLIPELHELIRQKKVPRFGIGWSRLASLGAAAVKITDTTLAIDEFKFNISPRLININLLPHSIGLPLTPTSIDDDGSAEIIFDIGRDQAIMSGYIRKIFKRKYIYSDEIRMFRGRKISISPARGRKMYIDGEVIKISSEALNIGVYENKIRIYHAAEADE